MPRKNYIFYTDPGHGWLAVERAELQRLGIEDQISEFSYEQGETVYLEEDCDASAFIQAKKDNGEEFLHEEQNTNEESPIRSYSSFRVAA